MFFRGLKKRFSDDKVFFGNLFVNTFFFGFITSTTYYLTKVQLSGVSADAGDTILTSIDPNFHEVPYDKGTGKLKIDGKLVGDDPLKFEGGSLVMFFANGTRTLDTSSGAEHWSCGAQALFGMDGTPETQNREPDDKTGCFTGHNDFSGRRPGLFGGPGILGVYQKSSTCKSYGEAVVLKIEELPCLFFRGALDGATGWLDGKTMGLGGHNLTDNIKGIFGVNLHKETVPMSAVYNGVGARIGGSIFCFNPPGLGYWKLPCFFKKSSSKSTGSSESSASSNSANKSSDSNQKWVSMSDQIIDLDTRWVSGEIFRRLYGVVESELRGLHHSFDVLRVGVVDGVDGGLKIVVVNVPWSSDRSLESLGRSVDHAEVYVDSNSSYRAERNFNKLIKSCFYEWGGYMCSYFHRVAITPLEGIEYETEIEVEQFVQFSGFENNVGYCHNASLGSVIVGRSVVACLSVGKIPEWMSNLESRYLDLPDPGSSIVIFVNSHGFSKLSRDFSDHGIKSYWRGRKDTLKIDDSWVNRLGKITEISSRSENDFGGAQMMYPLTIVGIANKNALIMGLVVGCLGISGCWSQIRGRRGVSSDRLRDLEYSGVGRSGSGLMEWNSSSLSQLSGGLVGIVFGWGTQIVLWGFISGYWYMEFLWKWVWAWGPLLGILVFLGSSFLGWVADNMKLRSMNIAPVNTSGYSNFVSNELGRLKRWFLGMGVPASALFFLLAFVIGHIGVKDILMDYERDHVKYRFRMDLQSPTYQSGQPRLMSYSELGRSYLEPSSASSGGSTTDSSSSSGHVVASNVRRMVKLTDLVKPSSSSSTTSEALPQWVLPEVPGRSFAHTSLDEYAVEKISSPISTSSGASSNGGSSSISTPDSLENTDSSFHNPWRGSSNVVSVDKTSFPKLVWKDYVPTVGECLHKQNISHSGQSSQGVSTSSSNSSSNQSCEIESVFKNRSETEISKVTLPVFGQTSNGQSRSKRSTQSGSSTADWTVSNEYLTKSSKKYPTLSRLIKENGNYWFISDRDTYQGKIDPIFLKYKTIVKFIFDLEFEITMGGSLQTINVWDVISRFLHAAPPSVKNALDKDNLRFVRWLINSKYGAFFVKRFMTMHANTTNSSEHSDGDVYAKRKSYFYDPSKSTNTASTGSTGSAGSSGSGNGLTKGLYYIDGKKAFFTFDRTVSGNVSSSQATTDSSKTSVDTRFKRLLFLAPRPDFQYLFYTVMNDPELGENSPMKIAFHNNLYNTQYDSSSSGQTSSSSNTSSKGFGKSKTTDSAVFDKTPGGDQSYSVIEAEVGGDKTEVRIVGLKEDSRGAYVKLWDGGRLINSLLYDQDNQRTTSNDVCTDCKIAISKFTAKKLKLKVGDTLTIVPKNHYKRFYKDFAPQSNTFKVVGVYDSFFRHSLFVSQKTANKVLGLDSDLGYNGIFSKTPKGAPHQLNKVITVFSPSNIYATVNLSLGGVFENFLKSSFEDLLPPTGWIKANQVRFEMKKNWETMSKWNGFDVDKETSESSNGQDNSHSKVMNHIVSQFGAGSPISHIGKDILDRNIYSDIVFNKIFGTIFSIINLLLGSLTPILLFSLYSLSSLVVDKMKGLLVTLNLLGFSDIESAFVVAVFLGTIFLLTVTLGSVLFYFGLNMYINILFNASDLLLPISASFKEIAISSGAFLSLFSFIFLRLFVKIRSVPLPLALKAISD